MTMLASDVNNPQFVGATDPDAALAARFYKKAVQNNFETSRQGRPIFQDVDYIEITTPGNQLNIIDTPVREGHKVRFHRQWAFYQNQQMGDSREIGTPVTQWPYLTLSQAEELRGLKFFTVEGIANASDQQINNVGMIGGMAPHSLRERAKAYLQAAAGTASAEHQSSEMAKRDEQIAALQRQVEALMGGQPAPVAAILQPAPKKEKKPMSPEHLAKMKAGREAARAAKQASTG